MDVETISQSKKYENHEGRKKNDKVDSYQENAKLNGKGPTQPIQPANQSAKAVVSFGDPANFQTKHPLQNRWTWWYDNPGKKNITKFLG